MHAFIAQSERSSIRYAVELLFLPLPFPPPYPGWGNSISGTRVALSPGDTTVD
jgi:hypothetical protein